MVDWSNGLKQKGYAPERLWSKGLKQKGLALWSNDYGQTPIVVD